MFTKCARQCVKYAQFQKYVDFNNGTQIGWQVSKGLNRQVLPISPEMLEDVVKGCDAGQCVSDVCNEEKLEKLHSKGTNKGRQSTGTAELALCRAGGLGSTIVQPLQCTDEYHQGGGHC